MNIKYLFLGIISGILLGSLVIWAMYINQRNVGNFVERVMKHCIYECMAAHNSEINCDNWCSR